MSSEPLKDPLNVLSPEMVKSLGPIRGIDTRIDQEINKHAYEICLKETYFRTIHWFKGKRHISHYQRKKHLFKLKQDIIHHCLANDLDPLNHLEEGSWGNFVVMPEIESSIYFGMLANRLFITPAFEVRTFLDFHSVHWKLVNDESSQPFGYFLKNLNFLVMLNLKRNMPDWNEPVIKQVRKWVAREFDNMTPPQLEEYHNYNSHPHEGEHPNSAAKSAKRHAPGADQKAKADRENRVTVPSDPSVTTKIDHGSTDVIVKLYFNLLKQANPGSISKEPFVNPGKVNFLLKNYFGIESAEPIDKNGGYTIDRPELIFFIQNFCKHLQVKPTSTSLTKRQLVEIIVREFPALFDGSVKSYYKNWSKLADNGNHELLNWRKHDVILTKINYYK